MENKDKSCCFSGHRKAHFDMEYSYYGQILKGLISKEVRKACDMGFDTFYTGMAYGFDILAADAVIKEKYCRLEEIKLVCAIPFRGQENTFSNHWRKYHDTILKMADKIVVLNEEYITGCYHERNRFLVDNSRHLIGFYSQKAGGTKHTFDYAEKCGLEIVNIWQVIQSQDPLN